VATPIQVSFDAADPPALGGFWAEVLGYVEQPPPAGFDTWEDALESYGIDTSDMARVYAIVDPEGVGPRFFFQKVPEGKTAKNRMHLDVNVGADLMESRAAELVALGAELVSGPHDEPGGHWIVMRDPEGNEFCLQ
jgi:hypothetical protein